MIQYKVCSWIKYDIGDVVQVMYLERRTHYGQRYVILRDGGEEAKNWDNENKGSHCDEKSCGAAEEVWACDDLADLLDLICYRSRINYQPDTHGY